ncbi:MAG: ATP-binding protein [Phaeodactylibacter sp.]|nr:ATP-binding protein [Phaeodactylibacter sp.]MCB9293300.1 ATP-binding protein [Lewinellaceae bacterium]MCO6489194.1 ATP-binding protein [Phaeodactylibacter sp.]
MLKLSSNPRNIALVESFVEQVVERYKLSPDVYGNILISLTEAVNNAIIHGNCEDESKTVRIQFQKRRGHLAVRVTDEGCGFDYQSVPDPTAPENLLQIGGRGVFLMQQLSDSVEFHNNGSTVEMQFKI